MCQINADQLAYLAKYTFNGSTYLSKPRVPIAHNISSPVIVFLFSCCTLSLASLVINDINSETHSCTVSLASFIREIHSQYARIINQLIYLPLLFWHLGATTFAYFQRMNYQKRDSYLLLHDTTDVRDWKVTILLSHFIHLS